MWERVRSTPEPEGDKKRRLKNEAILNSEHFIEACKRACITPTKRQASKWNRNKGLARKSLVLA